MSRSLFIKNCRVIDPLRGERPNCNIFIDDGIIASTGREEKEADEIIDAAGLCAAPGLVDMHVHLRDPGQTHKEDIITGCAAAAAGGVTSVAAMPNTSPACDNADTIHYIIKKAAGTGISVYPVAAVSKGLDSGEPTDFRALRLAGAAAFSDDGRPVASAALMLSAMKAASELGVPVISHCEDPSLAGGLVNEGTASAALGVQGMPRAAETLMAAREVILSLIYGLPVHIAHVSCRETVDIIRYGKVMGAKVTAETCPHYFSLSENRTLEKDADYRMNPPLRTPDDIRAVADGLRDGTLDVIVTDHAPHTMAEKSDFYSAPNGVVGLETSLSAGITFLVRSGRLTLTQLIQKMSLNPAKILGISAGTMEPGAPADIVLFDETAEYRVDPLKLHSKSANTSFKGMKLYGLVKYTLSKGKLVYKQAE